MNKKLYKKRKKRIENKILTGNYSNGVLINTLLRSGKLDKLIERLDTKSTSCNSSCIVDKGYLTAEEQFLNLIDNFIIYLKETFFMIEYSYLSMLLNEMIKSKYCNIFLSKYYWGDNKNISKFTLEFNKIIIHPFIKNMLYLEPAFKYQDNSLEKIKEEPTYILNSENKTQKMVKFLKDILLCNMNNQFQAMYLFTDMEEHVENVKNITETSSKSASSVLMFYYDIWEILYTNYEDKVEYAHLLLE